MREKAAGIDERGWSQIDEGDGRRRMTVGAGLDGMAVGLQSF